MRVCSRVAMSATAEVYATATPSSLLAASSTSRRTVVDFPEPNVPVTTVTGILALAMATLLL
jgi:hypothetical protein